MVKVCAHYCGTTILLAQFENEEEADEFMKHGMFLYEDVDDEDNYWIYPDEMFKEEDVPFEGLEDYEITDELPL